MYIFWVFFIFRGIRLRLYYLDLVVILEWLVYRFNSINLKFIILIDWISILFISFIILISSIIILYRITYIRGEKNINRFNYLLILFILSILLIVIRPNVVRILIGWDGLGMVSYCLVIYYHNYISYNSGIVTVLCNRIGDVGILIAIRIIMIVGRWDLVIFNRGLGLILIIMLAAITKRAQIPFSVWLPLAIAAPTPVSALVHSSTLVTAGVYLIIRFNNFLIETEVRVILSFISILTIFISGLIANFENDFKKIIALSTLRQLGLIMIVLRFGYRIIAYYHLLVHAIFKSILFMAAGAVIHLIKNTQDIRLLGNLNEVIPYVIIRLIISRIALRGIPFMAGFYRKDLIIEIIYRRKLNLFMLILMIISLSLTVSYSLRFFYYIFFNRRFKFYRYVYIKEDKIINISIVFIMLLRVIVGSVINWIFYFDYYIVYLPLLEKLVTLIRCMIGILIIVIVIIIGKIFKLYYYIYFFSSIWFLVRLYTVVYKPVNVYGVWISDIDKSWVEFVRKIFIIKFMWKKFNYIHYKLYIFVFIFVYFRVIMFIFI